MTFHMVKRAFFKLGLTFFALIIAFLTPESGFPSSGKSDLVFSNKPTKEFHKTISQVSSDNSKIATLYSSLFHLHL